MPLFYEWTRDYIKAFFTEGGDVTRIEDVARRRSTSQNPIDMEFGPDGSLYVLNYGNGFFGKNLPGAELVRIDYLGPRGNRSPTVTVAADQAEGAAPADRAVHEHGGRPGGSPLKYAWDFDADGTDRLAPAEPDAHVHRGGRVPRHPAR